MIGPVVVVVLIGLVVVLVFGTVALSAAVGILRWRRNSRSPVLTESATVVAKRQQARGTSSIVTDYFVTFQVRGAERIEFAVDGRDYGVLVERDRGELTHQGTRFRGFTRVPQDV